MCINIHIYIYIYILRRSNNVKTPRASPRGCSMAWGRRAPDHIYIYIYVYIYVYRESSLSLSVYIYIYICTQLCIHISLPVYTQYIHDMCIHIYIYIHHAGLSRVQVDQGAAHAAHDLREMGGAPRNPAPRSTFRRGLSNHQAATAQMGTRQTT